MSDVDENVADVVDNISPRNNGLICGVVEGFYGRPWTPEQRKDLFAKMHKLGMNSYLYAPKDDYKHRLYWRELYTVEEAEHLTTLIQAAKDNGIIFYYALSPGLDITYSSSKEITILKRKLEQVGQFGCNAFALLFDDIETDMSEADKEIFQSFGHAQVSVTNEVFQHVGQPPFLFCPTEYCASRAIPNVHSSEYLSTIGSKLLPGVDIMWTGSKVITKLLTVQSIVELTDVLKRPPVIWDNLHANDYDQKRLYLGPYSGRSPHLIPLLRGVLTNPNCEYEANYIAIHTLAQWSQCSQDGCKSLEDELNADIKLETEGDGSSCEDIPSQLSPHSYHPRQALHQAVTSWHQEFNKTKTAHGKTIKPQIPLNLFLPPLGFLPQISTGLGLPNVNQLHALAEVACEDNFIPPSTLSSLESVPEEQQTCDPPLEPMDCNPSPSSSPKHSDTQETASQSEDVMQTDSVDTANTEVSPDDANSNHVSQTEEKDIKSDQLPDCSGDTELTEDKKLTYEDLMILVDLFYLPFEHGHHGIQILQDFHWLKTNASRVIPATNRQQTRRVTSSNAEAQEWFNRAAKFDEQTRSVCRMFQRLTLCKNRALVCDLYPYVWDIRGVICMLNTYIKWLALGRVPPSVATYVQGTFSWFTKGWKEAFIGGEQEPWVFRGGLMAELQRLLPLDSVNDLFIWNPPEVPTTKTYTIRPYLPSDKEAVYEVCRKTCDHGMDGIDVFPEIADLIGDKSIGGFLSQSPEFSFVVEDEDTICGYALAALDAQQFMKKVETVWLPQLRAKYPNCIKESSTDMFSPAEEIICSIHTYKPYVPDSLHKLHPSIIRLNMLSSLLDLSVPKKLLACLMSALKANGSFGAYCEVNAGDKNLLDAYSKLGFLEVSLTSNGSPPSEDVVYLGRTF